MISGTTACTVKYNQAGNGNYNPAPEQTETVTAVKKSLSVIADDKTITFGDPSPSFGVHYSGFEPADDASSLGGSLGFSFAGTGTTVFGPSATPPTNAGSYSITPSGYTSNNYSFDYQAGSFTIKKADQAIAITTHAPGSKVYGGQFTVAATGGGSGNPVGFTSAGGCSNSGATFTMTSGTTACTVKYNQAGNGNYNPAPEQTETVTAVKADQAALNVTQPTSGTYGLAYTLAAAGGSGTGAVTFAASGTACSIPSSGANAGKLVITSGTGTCAVTATKATDANYNAKTSTALNVSINKATLTVEPSPKTPSRQYSDPNPSLPPGYSGFVNGDTDGVLDTKPSCSTTAMLTSGPNMYPITCSGGVDDNYSFSYVGGTLTVTKEDASSAFSGSTYYSTPTAGGSVTATLSAVITDAADGSRGDIRNAKVTFVNRDASSAAFAGCSNLPVGLVTVGDTTVGTATCNTTLTAGTSQTAANLYTVGIVVNNWYSENDSTDNTVVTVAQSIAGSITGGGFLVNELSGGQYAGDLGKKTNFGFNVRLDKNNAPKGQINTIVRRNGRVYQIKGNAMTSLTTRLCTTGSASTTCPGTATFNGKANIQDITNPLAALSVDGNASLQVTITDKGEPGANDTIGVTLWDKSGGLWFSSRWDLSVSSSTIEQLLKGGNLVVR
jgi:hypothetical protein